jgi:valyl-tRNA synthetase
MSKSKGNVIDPLVMMDKYGTDAFRFTLAVFAAQGRDVKFSEERVEGYRHFVNKLWNASRFILSNAGDSRLVSGPDMKALDLGSRWIISRLSAASEEVGRALDEYRFNDAAGALYSFVWHELCDWYIEMVKPLLYEESENREAVRECLIYLLERTLRLLHPFMPFVTEEIWQTAPHDGESIVNAAYPADIPKDDEAEKRMEVLMEAVTAVRTIRGELNISPSLELKAMVRTNSAFAEDVLNGSIICMKKLSRADFTAIGLEVVRPKEASVAVRTHVEVYVPLEGLLDIDLEIERINRELEKLRETETFLSRKLNNDDFVKRAPDAIVAKEREKYNDCMTKIEKVSENLSRMLSMKGARD